MSFYIYNKAESGWVVKQCDPYYTQRPSCYLRPTAHTDGPLRDTVYDDWCRGVGTRAAFIRLPSPTWLDT